MTAFRGTYSDWKLVKTRGVVQVVFEVPLADADKAYEVLGGMPNSASEQWFGIAAISAEAKPKRGWEELSPTTQAGIRCKESPFIVFLKEERAEDWHEAMCDPEECVRLICGVESRADLSTNQRARMIWKQLSDQFDAWKALEHA